MKRYMFCSLVGLTLVAASLAAQTSLTPPVIPEEARKHFIMGATLFKDAKAPEDYVQVENEFKQAATLAPQWPDPRYNLALAKEAAGDYDGAMADLKLYQQFKLSEADARTAQDKIYEVEAKQAKANDPATKEREKAAQSTKEIRQAQLAFASLMQKLDGAVFMGDRIFTFKTVRYQSKLHFLRDPESGLLECATWELITQSDDPKDPVTGRWNKLYEMEVRPASDTEFKGCVIMSKYRISSDGGVLNEIGFNGEVDPDGSTYYRQ